MAEYITIMSDDIPDDFYGLEVIKEWIDDKRFELCIRAVGRKQYAIEAIKAQPFY